MRKIVIATLLIVVIVFGCTYAWAGTMYDDLKRDVAKREKSIADLEKANADLQKYLDAVDSGDMEEWEAARQTVAFLDAIMFKKDMDEIDAVKKQIETNNSMIKTYEASNQRDQHKMDIYFHGFIKKDTEKIDEILANGNRTIPADISDNFYYIWPYTDIPDGLLTDGEVFTSHAGDVYLVPATIIEYSVDGLYRVDINGITVKASIASEDHVEIGETVNIYFTPFVFTKDLPYIVIGDNEDAIDAYHYVRMRE